MGDGEVGRFMASGNVLVSVGGEGGVISWGTPCLPVAARLLGAAFSAGGAVGVGMGAIAGVGIGVAVGASVTTPCVAAGAGAGMGWGEGTAAGVSAIRDGGVSGLRNSPRLSPDTNATRSTAATAVASLRRRRVVVRGAGFAAGRANGWGGVSRGRLLRAATVALSDSNSSRQDGHLLR